MIQLHQTQYLSYKKSFCERFLICFLTAQLEELNNQHLGRIELLIDNMHHYFLKVSEKNICFVKSQEKLL